MAFFYYIQGKREAMRFSTLILILVTMAIPKSSEAQELKDYQWKNRILLLVDESPDTDALQSQLDELTSDKKALEDRDLIIFRLTPEAVFAWDGSRSSLSAEMIFRNLNLDSGFTGTILIGKDGGSKLEKPFEVSAQTIFALIDGMPMRRAEMRKEERKN